LVASRISRLNESIKDNEIDLYRDSNWDSISTPPNAFADQVILGRTNAVMQYFHHGIYLLPGQNKGR
jgi:hypothetical protein